MAWNQCYDPEALDHIMACMHAHSTIPATFVTSEGVEREGGGGEGGNGGPVL